MNFEAIAKTVLGTGTAPDPVKIRIPRDHPAAPMLKHLFVTLATEERTTSGIYVKQSSKSPAGVRKFLEALRDVLAKEGIDLDQMAEKILNHKSPQPLEGIMNNPLMMSKLVMNAFGGDAPVTPEVRAHHMKRAEEILRRAGADEPF